MYCTIESNGCISFLYAVVHRKSDAFPNKYGNTDEKLSKIMSKDGAVAKQLEAIKNSFNYPDMYYVNMMTL